MMEFEHFAEAFGLSLSETLSETFLARDKAATDAMLTHHKLKVYEKALALGASAAEFSSRWGRRHAIVDHFRRAAESIVLNIAEGARLGSGPEKARMLKAAAYLDLYQQKALLRRWKLFRVANS